MLDDLLDKAQAGPSPPCRMPVSGTPWRTPLLKQPLALPSVPRDSDKARLHPALILFHVECAGMKECIRAKVPVLLSGQD